MKTPATFLGHPIHQMVIVLPLGLLATATAFDVAGSATRRRGLLRTSHTMLSAGLVTGLGAAIPGAIDFFSIPPRTRAKRIGLLHGVGNLVVTGLFAASWIKRRRTPAWPGSAAVALSVTGAALALVTGWLGGELVDTLGIGVHEDANVNAPNSLSSESSRRPITKAGVSPDMPESAVS
jgi:uncharacterized membrane protein